MERLINTYNGGRGNGDGAGAPEWDDEDHATPEGRDRETGYDDTDDRDPEPDDEPQDAPR